MKTGDTALKAKRKSKGLRILVGSIAGLAVCIILVFGGFLSYMRLTYAEFYSKAEWEFQIPGLNSGFVPQDIAFEEASGAWLFSGYDMNGFSPIWRIDENGVVARLKIIEANGNVYHGHGGGIAVFKDYAYLTCENGYMVLPVREMLQAGDNEEVCAIAKVEVGFDPAFINVQDDVLYTGVFYCEGPYDTPDKMHLTSPDGTQNHAVMYAYEMDSSSRYGVSEQPFAVYSIPDKVQGVALTSTKQFVFSTSWGLAESVLPIYSTDGLKANGTYEVSGNEIDLFFMDGQNLVSQIKAPPMMEGIIYHDGRIWMTNESASDKYIFGKFIDGATVYSISA